MAHELEIQDGKAMMAYAGEVPWHGLGTQVDPDLTPVEMMKAAGLDWTVSKHRLFAELPDPKTGVMTKYPTSKYAIVRDTDNAILTETGHMWQPTQNKDAFEFFNSFHAAGAKMETAGSLFDGKRVWALAKLGSSFSVGGKDSGDTTNGYLLFSLPHVMGNSIQVRTTSVRVVCNNTLSWSLQKSTDSEYRQSHIGAFNFERAQEVVEVANQKIIEQGKWTEKLVKQKFSQADAARFFAHLISDEGLLEFEEDQELLDHITYERSGAARITGLMGSYEYAPGATPGTAYGVLNAVTHFVDHVSGSNPMSRLNSAWYGSGNVLKSKAVKALEELIA